MEEQFRKIAAKNLDNFIGEAIKTQDTKFKKKAGDLSYDAAFDSSRVPLNFQDPLYDAYSIMFPEYNLVEANKRYRYFYKWNPILGNCVDIHATFPFTDFEVMVNNEEVKEYYEFLTEKYNLEEMNVLSSRDETLLGEAIFLGNWDPINLEWSEWLQYPPEFVEITTIPGTSQKIFTIKPDPEIQQILQQNTEAAKILSDVLQKINSSYFNAAKAGESYNLPENRILYFANKVDGYSKRGYPLTKRALQDLLHEMDIRSLEHTFVQRHMFPLKIFKLGSPEIGWIPSQKHFQQFKKLLIQATADPDFSLIYHFGLQVDYVGTKDKIEDLGPHFERCAKRIMNAFFVNDALLNGEAPSYAGQVANTKLLMYRFTTVRNSREHEYRDKIFLPIARQQKLTVQEQGEKKTCTLVKSKNFRATQYYLPKFMWRQQNIVNNNQLQQMLVSLYQDGALPFGVISDILGLSDKILENYRKKEQGTYANKLTREIVDEVVKQDPGMSLKFALGEDPIELLKRKVKNNNILQEQQEQDKEFDSDLDSSGDDFSNFDSRAPLDLGSPEPVTEEPKDLDIKDEPMSETGEPSVNEPEGV